MTCFTIQCSYGDTRLFLLTISREKETSPTYRACTNKGLGLLRLYYDEITTEILACHILFVNVGLSKSYVHL